MKPEEPTILYLSNDEAQLFVKFQQHHELIAYFIGYIDSLGVDNLGKSQIVLDVDDKGIVGHVAITKHFSR